MVLFVSRVVTAGALVCVWVCQYCIINKEEDPLLTVSLVFLKGDSVEEVLLFYLPKLGGVWVHTQPHITLLRTADKNWSGHISGGCCHLPPGQQQSDVCEALQRSFWTGSHLFNSWMLHILASLHLHSSAENASSLCFSISLIERWIKVMAVWMRQ